MKQLTGAEAIVDSLIANGVDTIFALPGGQLDHLFDAIYERRDQIQLIHSRHEQGVAYMAYGYARSTGKVGVCAVVPGPGLLNASAALCTAWGNYAPVLCISGQIPSQAIGKGYGELHEIDDQLGMLAHISKWVHHIESPETAPAAVHEAFAQLNSGAPRPVVIEMPMDIMGQQAPVQVGPPNPPIAAPAAPEAAVEEALRLLTGARQPMIVVGSGALGAAAEVSALAHRLQAPVMACRGGKGILPADDPLSANFPMGHRLWAAADVVLAVGTRLHWPLTMWGLDEDLKIIRVDIEESQINRIAEPAVGMVGDAAEVVGRIDNGLADAGFKAASRLQELSRLKATVAEEIRNTVAPQMAYLDVIRDCLPEDGIFVDEVTQVGFASWYGFETSRPRQHISAGYMGTLGYGYATALGVVAGNPGRKVIQISGDGGIMFNIQELATAVQYELPLVTIIFNDRRYTNVQRQQKEWFDGRVICSDLHNPDFVALARSFGADGYLTRDPQSLRAAIESAFARPGPSLIEVAVDEFFPAPWPFLMMPQNRRSLCS
ncbi:MAG: thiamine pyrophosphate-dependent enzyme [Pseudomonadota bacterium]